ncbi:hypothetical protein [Mycobacterium sp.]|uniref:hypothetical protein n=1 Tax=Mycobacterium sp. TaxID=1785 RepID=UPI002C6DC32D|nr:hypothetical protein [Mycobacterium sp.]HTQ22428.1 hypothetical protein [Mycobacterium sp.]
MAETHIGSAAARPPAVQAKPPLTSDEAAAGPGGNMGGGIGAQGQSGGGRFSSVGLQMNNPVFDTNDAGAVHDELSRN